MNNMYEEKYFFKNGQSGDRIGLKFFSDILKEFFLSGIIFEYGCGTGFFLKKFNKNYKKMAYDISEYALGEAQKNNPDALMVKNPEIEINSGSLDCIACLHVLEHIKAPESVLATFFDKICFGGILFIIVPNSLSVGKILKKDKWFAYRDATHISILSAEKWIDIIKGCGFDVIKTATDGLWDVPYLPIIPKILQKLLFYPPAALQILSKKTFLPLCLGENLIIISKKNKC